MNLSRIPNLARLLKVPININNFAPCSILAPFFAGTRFDPTCHLRGLPEQFSGRRAKRCVLLTGFCPSCLCDRLSSSNTPSSSRRPSSADDTTHFDDLPSFSLKTQLALQLLLAAQLPVSGGGLSAASLYLHSEFPFPFRRRLHQLSFHRPHLPQTSLFQCAASKRVKPCPNTLNHHPQIFNVAAQIETIGPPPSLLPPPNRNPRAASLLPPPNRRGVPLRARRHATNRRGTPPPHRRSKVMVEHLLSSTLNRAGGEKAEARDLVARIDSPHPPTLLLLLQFLAMSAENKIALDLSFFSLRLRLSEFEENPRSSCSSL